VPYPSELEISIIMKC